MTASVALNGAADCIRSLRLRIGLTQRELADQLRVDQATISRWELGREPKGAYAWARAELDKRSSVRDLIEPGLLGGGDLPVCWPDLLKFFRTARNISQEELAWRLQSSPESVSRWERGLHRPDLKTKNQLRDLFLTPLEEDGAIQRLVAGVEAAQGHISLHYGPLSIALSQSLQGRNEDKGHDVGLFSNIARTRDGKFRDFWHNSCQNGFAMGEVPACLAYWELANGDQRKILGVSVGRHDNSILWICKHLPCTLAQESRSDSEVLYLHADQLIA